MMRNYKCYIYRMMWSLALFGLCALTVDGTAVVANDPIEFYDVKRQAEEFIQYNISITLTPEQEAVKHQALSNLPAPCCSDFSIETCCCTCNMARTVWGLSKFLITQHQYDSTQVRETVTRWFHAINPDGFSGRACFDDHCGLPFKNDGCGGMHELKS